MKFDMGSTTLSTLTKSTSGSSDDLGALIQQLTAAAQPLEGRLVRWWGGPGARGLPPR
ncbi:MULTISPECIES: hypothetical protein [unclassified Streptomyces]|uniref:hypothetical protein n=1 Tax=unclassified Streptomyces TaxID=2593676 RepID=UPI00278C39BE|nr:MULTISPECIES: hypothetical protein [unclassified Streptomyces]